MTRTTSGLGQWFFGGIALFALGCGGQSKAVKQTLSPLPPAAVDDHVVLVDSARAEAFLLDVSGTSPPSAPTVLPVIAGPTHLEQRKGAGNSKELLVLSVGHADDGTAPAADPGLVVIGANGKSRTYSYAPAFDAVRQSEDGHYAFLFFDPKAPSTDTNLLSNQNLVAIVDLTTTDAPVVRNLRSFGGLPHDVAFSPEMAINGDPHRRLAVVLFDSQISILDLDHLDRPEYFIELQPSGTDPIHAAQVLFSSAARKIYVRAQGSSDVYVITLSDGALPSAAGGDAATASLNDFTPSPNQLEAGVNPSDMALYEEQGNVRLLVAAPGSSEAVVIDPDTSNTTHVPLPASQTSVLVFQGTAPRDANSSTRALLYTTGSNSVTFMDLAGIEAQKSLNVSAMTTPDAYSTLTLLDSKTAMLIHQSTGLSLLDLDERTLGQISGPNLAGAVADPDVPMLWLASGNRLGFLDVAHGFEPNEVRLDAPIENLVTVPSASRPRVAVTHPSSTGWATVLDAANPTNLSAAYSMRGFLISGGGS